MTKEKLIRNLKKLSRIPSDINEHLPMLYFLSSIKEEKTIVELGVRAAVSTQAFLAAVCESSNSKLYSYDIVDIREKSHYKNAGILERMPEAVNFDFWEFKIGDSLEIHSKWEDNSIDLLFIDTKHKPKQIHNELTLWHKKVKQDGFIIMHDVALKKARLEEGILLFLEENKKYKYIRCAYNNGLGIIYNPMGLLD